MGIAGRNRIVAFACIVCTVRSDAADLFVRPNLVEQVREHRRVPNAAARRLNCAYLQCILVDPDMYLAPEAAFGAAVLARVPFINRQVMLASPRGGLRPPP